MKPIKSGDFFTEDLMASLGVPREMYRLISSVTLSGDAASVLRVSVTFAAMEPEDHDQ